MARLPSDRRCLQPGWTWTWRWGAQESPESRTGGDAGSTIRILGSGAERMSLAEVKGPAAHLDGSSSQVTVESLGKTLQMKARIGSSTRIQGPLHACGNGPGAQGGGCRAGMVTRGLQRAGVRLCGPEAGPPGHGQAPSFYDLCWALHPDPSDDRGGQSPCLAIV